MNFNLRARMLTEFLGTAFLLAAVVGSGIMGEQLAGGNVAIALLANTLATGAMLTVLILTLGPISGAHFNPIVTLTMAWAGNLPWRQVPAYLTAQFAGAFAGVAAAHLMFGLRLFFASTHARHGSAQLWSEAVATFGLLLVIWGCSRLRPSATAYAVGAYITAAYWFTASTFRESGGYAGPFCQQYVRRDSSAGCTAVHGGSTGGRIRCDSAISMAACGKQCRRARGR